MTMVRRVVIAIVALVALLGVCFRAPSLDELRRCRGSLEASASHAEKNTTSFDKPTAIGDVPVARPSRGPDPRLAPSLDVCVNAPCVLPRPALATRDASDTVPPAWTPRFPSHADLMVFLN